MPRRGEQKVQVLARGPKRGRVRLCPSLENLWSHLCSLLTATVKTVNRILFLCSRVGLLNRGAEKATVMVADAIRNETEVAVASWGATDARYRVGPIPEFSWVDGLPVLVRKVLRRLQLDRPNLEAISFSFGVVGVIRRFRPSICVSTDGPWQVRILRPFSRIFGFKVVTVGHGGLEIEKQQLSARPDAHITLSPFAHRSLVPLFRKEAIFRIPNPVDTSQFFPGTGEFDLGLKRPVVLVVAAGVGYKNVHRTIEAVAETGFSLIWCGDGPLRSDLIKFAEQRLGFDRFRWMALEQSEMPGLYRSVDLFTLASEKNQEAQGLVYLEALASGLRCVATDDDIRREALGSWGFFTNPHDRSQYADCLRAAWGASSPNEALSPDLEGFSPISVAGDFLKVFDYVAPNERESRRNRWRKPAS